MGPTWRYAFASVIGTSHLKTGQVCQDASDCRIYQTPDGQPILVAIAADGAGSAKFAETGSQLACDVLMKAAGAFLEAGGVVSKIDSALANEWLGVFQAAVECRATEAGASPRDFACTLLVAIVGSDSAAFWQIGDGCIIIRSSDEEEFCWVFWPDRGEYENVTFFATETSAADHLQFESVQRKIDCLSVLTDGLQRLALHYETTSAHGPFFRGLFLPLESVSGAGLSQELSRSLARFLESERVNSRTDDDKTLILASRGRAAMPVGAEPSVDSTYATSL
jgi:hypothetical protein